LIDNMGQVSRLDNPLYPHLTFKAMKWHRIHAHGESALTMEMAVIGANFHWEAI